MTNGTYEFELLPPPTHAILPILVEEYATMTEVE
jgi:hypothetical protein